MGLGRVVDWVARVGRDGRLVWPADHRFPRVDRLAATAEQVEQTARAQSFLQLAPWEGTERKAGAAFVFDLIAVPEGKPDAKP